MDCIFCRIVSGDIPSKKLFESASIVAFLDAFPLAAGHCLVIPKKHYKKIQDMPDDINADLFGIVHKLVSKADKLTGGTLVAIHNGAQSGQEIPHVHVHIIPRKAGDGAGPVHVMFGDNLSISNAELDGLQKRLSL